MADLPPIVAHLLADDSGFDAVIERAKQELARFNDEEAQAKLDVDISAVLRAVELAQADIDALHGKEVDIAVNLSGSNIQGLLSGFREAESGILDFQASLGQLARSIEETGAGARGFGTGLGELSQALGGARAATDESTVASDVMSAAQERLDSVVQRVSASLREGQRAWASYRTEIDGVNVSLTQTVADATAAAGAAGGADKGGGGGLLAALGFGGGGGGGGRFGGGRFGGILGLGGGLAASGSLAGLAGFSALHLLGTPALSVASAGLGAAAGGGLLAAGNAGILAAGMGSDLAVMKDYSSELKSVSQAQDAYNKAVVVHGVNSTQAASAQYDLNKALSGMSPPLQAATLGLIAAKNALAHQWDQATDGAKLALANLVERLVPIAQTYIPLIGEAAQRNFTLIGQNIQPLIDYLRGPAAAVFQDLENIFASRIPLAMHAFTQATELIIKTIDMAAHATGGFLPMLDAWLTRMNGVDFGKWSSGVTHLIDLWHTFAAFVRQAGDVIINVLHDDAGTGQAIIQTFTTLLERVNAYLTSTKGAAAVHDVFQTHKEEILAIIDALAPLAGAIGRVEIALMPTLMSAVTTVIRAFTPLIQLLTSNPFTSFLLGLALIELKFHTVSGAASAFGSAMGLLRGVILLVTGTFSQLAQGTALAEAFGSSWKNAFANAAGPATAFGGAAKGAANDAKTLGADAAGASSGLIVVGRDAENAAVKSGGLLTALGGLVGGAGKLAAAWGPMLAVIAAGVFAFQQSEQNTQHTDNTLKNFQQTTLGTVHNTGDLNNAISQMGQQVKSNTPWWQGLADQVSLFGTHIHNTSDDFKNMQTQLQNVKGALNDVAQQTGTSSDKVITFGNDVGLTVQKLVQSKQPAQDIKQAIANIADGAQQADPIVQRWAFNMQQQLEKSGQAAQQNQIITVGALTGVQSIFEQTAGTIGHASMISQNDVTTATQEMERQWTLMGNTTLEDTTQWSGQMHAEFNDAMRIVAAEMNAGGQLSVQDLSTQLNLGIPQIMNILGDYKLQFQGTQRTIADLGNLAGQGFATGANSQLLAGMGAIVNTLGGYDRAIAAGLDPLLAAIGRNINLANFANAQGPAAANEILGSFATAGIHPQATGGMLVNHPMFVVGEESPQHPEVVIATNPAYRARNVGLWQQAGAALGIPGFAAGGCAGACGGKCKDGICPKGLQEGGFMDPSQVPAPPQQFLNEGGAQSITGLAGSQFPGAGFVGFQGATLLFNAVKQFVQAQEMARAAAAAAQFGATGVGAGQAQAFAASHLGQFGWGQDQMGCLIALWNQESGWNPAARNPSSGACGIPQALPCDKMGPAAAGGDAGAQILWGLSYIQGRYGSPCGAEDHERSAGWYAKGGIVGPIGSTVPLPVAKYDSGGFLPPGPSIAINNTGSPEPVGGSGTVITIHSQPTFQVSADVNTPGNRAALEKIVEKHDKQVLQQIQALMGGAY